MDNKLKDQIQEMMDESLGYIREDMQIWEDQDLAEEVKSASKEDLYNMAMDIEPMDTYDNFFFSLGCVFACKYMLAKGKKKE